MPVLDSILNKINQTLLKTTVFVTIWDEDDSFARYVYDPIHMRSW